jgi:transposase
LARPQVRALLDSRAREIESLKLLIAKLRRMQFGRSSERLEREIEQLELALDEFETQVPIATSPTLAVVTERSARSRTLPEHLPRERVVHEPACSCPQCGADMRAIAEDSSLGALMGQSAFATQPGRRATRPSIA